MSLLHWTAHQIQFDTYIETFLLPPSYVETILITIIIDLGHYQMQTQSIQTTRCLTMTEVRKEVEVDIIQVKQIRFHQVIHTNIVNIRNGTGYALIPTPTKRQRILTSWEIRI